MGTESMCVPNPIVSIMFEGNTASLTLSAAVTRSASMSDCDIELLIPGHNFYSLFLLEIGVQ